MVFRFRGEEVEKKLKGKLFSLPSVVFDSFFIGQMRKRDIKNRTIAYPSTRFPKKPQGARSNTTDFQLSHLFSSSSMARASAGPMLFGYQRIRPSRIRR